MDPTLVASLVALYSVVVMAVMQLGLKTLLEQLPFMKPVDGQVHDAVLRLVVLGLQASLVVATALTTRAFAGLAWYDLLALAFGQSVISHGIFSIGGPSGSGTTPAPVPPILPPAGA